MIDVAEALCATLWYLSNQVSMRDISDRFNLAKSTVHEVVYKVVRIIANHASDYIKWPTVENVDSTVHEFELLAGFPGKII